MASRRRRWRRIIVGTFVISILAAAVYATSGGPQSGHVVDEARSASRDPASFAAANEDYFREMDGGIALTEDEVKGRNMWIVWTGGNDRFWNEFIKLSFGNFDLLKVLSSYPGLKFSRDSRWNYLGLLNEPCFMKATGPDTERYGLWLDRREPSCASDPFENPDKYPGVKIGARGSVVPVGSYYGSPSGIVGLRLFPNPDFDEAAKRVWDPVRYYTDPSYYNEKSLVRPYRVGMSCGFCHVGPNPVNPPIDPEHPKWENMSSLVGAQYYWVDRIFNYQADPKNFVFQLAHTSRPGALDTSLISTDYMNNPRTMNSIYQVPARFRVAKERGREQLAGSNLDNKQFNSYLESGPLTEYFKAPDIAWVPHVQKDASDSVGALAALNRVYLNIGLFSEEWLLHFNALAGGKPISPMRVSVAQKNSSYWGATENQTPAMAAFLMKASGAHRLADAPGGASYLASDTATLDRGKTVFAETCARCHSSKYPEPPPAAHPDHCTASNYLDCWSKYWAWTKTPEFKSKMGAIVKSPDFLSENFLSNDMRVPSNLLQTNLCSPLATNAISGHIWDDFSSASYKSLPPVGDASVIDPVTGKPRQFSMPAGGRGYSRPPTLVSIWSSAPFLLNNSLGRFEPEPSVEARMRSFDDSIRKLLWPERREMDSKLGTAAGGAIDRLEHPAYLELPAGHLPGAVKPLLGTLAWMLPDVFINQTRRIDFKGSTTLGNATIEKVSLSSSPLATFSAGAPLSGPGIPDGASVIVFDAAKQVLTINRPAIATAENITLTTDTPDAGVRIGPIPAGMPISLVAGVELAPETGGYFATFLHDIKLASKFIGMPSTFRRIAAETDPAKRESLSADLQKKLLAENKCPDLVVNRGHYFGTDKFGEEPGLSDSDKEALIVFLKTF